MNALDRGSCIFLLGLSVLVGLMSLRLGIGGLELMGAGFMPFLASILLFVLTVIVLIKGLRTKQGGEEKTRLTWKALEKPLKLVVGLIGYAFLLMPLGYLIVTFLFVFFMFTMMQPQKWRMDLVFAALVAAASFVLFDTLLSVRLPPGILTMLR